MTELFLVRHGETEWNRQRRIQGRTDIPLNATGRAQALNTASLLAAQHWDAIVTSPLMRAHETAEIIANTLKLKLEVMDALTERDYGEAEGLTGAQLDARLPSPDPAPDRESREHVTHRVQAALITLSEQRPGQRILAVTHGGVIRSLLLAIDPVGGAHRREPITNGSVHSFRTEGRALRLVQFDDPLEASTVGDPEENIERQNVIEQREGSEG